MLFLNNLLSPYSYISDEEYKKIIDSQTENLKGIIYDYTTLNEGFCALCKDKKQLARRCEECTQLLCHYHYTKHIKNNHDTFFCKNCGAKMRIIDVFCTNCKTYNEIK